MSTIINPEALEELLGRLDKFYDKNIPAMANRLADIFNFSIETATEKVNEYYKIIPDSSALPEDLLIKRLEKQKTLRQYLATLEFNDCHDPASGQFCADDTGMMDHSTTGMGVKTAQKISAPAPKAGFDDLRFTPARNFSGAVLSPVTADRQATLLASRIRVNGIDNVDVAPITRARADFIGVDRDTAGLVVTKGGVALAAVIGEPDGKARIVPLDADRQDYNIIKHAAISMFAKESVVEFNDCHLPAGDGGGQFCSGDGGGGSTYTADGKTFPTGRIGGTTTSKGWNPVADNPTLKIWEPVELSPTPTQYHTEVGTDLAQKFNADPAAVIEGVRKASEMTYNAIPVGDKMSKDIMSTVGQTAEVEARIKGPVSAEGKLLRKPDEYSTLSDLDDVIGMRVVTSGTSALDDQQAAVATFDSKYKILENDNSTVKGRDDGYRAVHLSVQDPETGLIAEVQVKTENQDKWSHWSWSNIYKPDSLNESQLQVLISNRDNVELYAKRMSDYYYALDTGAIPAGTAPPDCPDYVKASTGCLE